MANRKDRARALAQHSRFYVGDLQVHPDRQVVVRNGDDIPLETREMEVLRLLAKKSGEVVSTDVLLIEIWKGDFYSDNPVNKTIHGLRKAIGDDTRAPRYIKTLRGRGYQLIPPVSFSEDYQRMPKTTEVWTSGSPFVGLAAFDAKHAQVFSGRSRMTAEVLKAMRTQIDHEQRFLLIVGASGCGKTSLLRAGTIPLLTQSGGFGGLRALSVASCDLAAAQGNDVMTPLAAALTTWTLGDRAVFLGKTIEELKLLLSQTPKSIQQIIEEAFRRYPERGMDAQPHAHLLLTIDHAEALVATAREPAANAIFERALCALCDTPRALVVMLARSDYDPKLAQALPMLTERKAGGGHLDVLTPKYGEIGEIIREPVWQAGLKFGIDEHDRERLDDTLLNAANGQPDALPLLQHTLQYLYERRDEDGTLNCDAYREIGGLEGAIAHRAKQVFAALSSDAQATLDSVLAKLIVIQPDSGSVSARRCRFDELQSNAVALVEAFVDGRLFVRKLHDGQPHFGVAHEALLRQWPRAVEWVEDNRRLLMAKARLQRASCRWVEEGHRDDHLLNQGRPLGEALEVVKRFPDELTSVERSYVEKSQQALKHRQIRRAIAVVALAVSTGLSFTLAVAAWTARNEANERRMEAQQLADFMLGDLASELRTQGNLSLLNGISEISLQYLQHRSRENLNESELVNLSKALCTLGDIMMKSNSPHRAEVLFLDAQEASWKAYKLNPDSAATVYQIGQSSYWLGFLHFKRKNFASTRRYWSAYLKYSNILVGKDKTNAAWLTEKSYAENNMGTLEKASGNITLAISHFSASEQLKRIALGIRPSNELKMELAETLSWISSALEAEGDLASAMQQREKTIETLREFAESDPDAHEISRRLANSLLHGARLALRIKRQDRAISMIEESIDIMISLTKISSKNLQWQADLALIEMEASEIYRLSGRRENAANMIMAASVTARRHLNDPDGLPDWKRLQAVIDARASRFEPHPVRRQRLLTTSITALSALSRDRPNDVSTTLSLASALIVAADSALSAGDRASAEDTYEHARTLLEPIAKNTRDIRVLEAWASVHVALGRTADIEPQLHWLRSIGFAHPERK
jgi:eukaryotic-like serine/threonine-protein kinase